MTLRDLVRALGGYQAVADALKIEVGKLRTYAWRNALPWHFHIEVWKLATAAGVPWCPPGGDGWALRRAEDAEWIGVGMSDKAMRE